MDYLRGYTAPCHLLLLIADGYFTPDQIDALTSAVDELCLQVRSFAIPLVDAFALSDHIINSPLGKWDGSVYESYFAQVQSSNPLPKEHPYFERLIRPLLERKNDTFEDPGEEMGLEEELKEMEEDRKAAGDREREKERHVRRED
ncbi:hypothetical protein M231_06596 [Tremella mesenterica]|uniref:Acyl-CoA oxidase C-terminal domain-containing protein n=1 Tax=Tremella mesenterica TaxID=5217 RepID=A0A4Q1BDZ8_TREME|nr:hypothetical protein M231_06596 [Tremella mesenterica]